MLEDKKNVELKDDELDQVAGGLTDGVAFKYRCGFCGQTFTFYTKAEAMEHVKTCPKNLNNM